MGLCYGLSSSPFIEDGCFDFVILVVLWVLCFDFGGCDLICDLVGFWVFVVI